MDKIIGKEIEKIYRNLRIENEIRAENKTGEVYAKHPLLKQLDREIASENAKIALEIAGDGVYRETSPKKDELLTRKAEYVRSHNLTLKYHNPVFNCKLCKDTGIIDSSDYKRCSCYKTVAYPVLLEKCNFNNIRNYSFDKLNLNLFSNEADSKKYKTESSPRKNIEGISKITEKFADNINCDETKNLFFIGKPGTGKTFISGCTAHKAISNGFSTYYLPAPAFFEKMANYRVLSNSFTPDPERLDLATQEHLFLLNCDLLIIDDLGTEPPNSNRQPDLLSVMNYRINQKKKIIISTNLDINNLSSIFDERVMSRIYGEFTVLRFIGDDLRHILRQGF